MSPTAFKSDPHMAPKVTQVLEEFEKRQGMYSITLSPVPPEESKWPTWKFHAVGDIKTKLQPFKAAEGMSEVVDEYIDALKHSKEIALHEDLVTIDLYVATALKRALQAHPKKDDILDALFNGDIEDGLRTLIKMESKIRTGTVKGKQNVALQELVGLECADEMKMDEFIDHFMKLAKLAGETSNDQLLTGLLIARLNVFPVYESMVQAFQTVPEK